MSAGPMAAPAALNGSMLLSLANPVLLVFGVTARTNVHVSLPAP